MLRWLPWLIGAGGLVVYLLTLSAWISLLDVGTVARLSGWLWQTEVGRPLMLLVFSPFRVLPESWLPLALNLFTAVCASIVLVQLARSVALLRHDVAPDDRFRNTKTVSDLLATRTAWLPPVLAAVVCGLQPTYWEHATSATGEMLSLLCFAHAIRCLLYLDLAYDEWKKKGLLTNLAGLRDAIYHGAVKRVRPKAMTACVIIAGLAPILWSHGAGADVMKRIATPMVGGVITSTLMELLGYPAIFYIWRKHQLPNTQRQ